MMVYTRSQLQGEDRARLGGRSGVKSYVYLHCPANPITTV